MKQYQALLERVLLQGSLQDNRTGIPAISKAGDMLSFDLAEGFPVITIRKAAWKSAVGEMVAFINGFTNAEQFRALKCKFWDANANEVGLAGHENPWLNNPNRKGQDDLGEVYGYQWRNWQGQNSEFIDQFKNAIEQLLINPTNRRIIVNAWAPDRFDHMALPPCHVMHQWVANVEKKELNLNMFIRSNDLFLGAPANIVQYAFLLEVVATATGFTPRFFNYFIGDAHIYVNHMEQVNTILAREPYSLPQLVYKKEKTTITNVGEAMNWLEQLHPDDFELENYQHHEALTGVMAV